MSKEEFTARLAVDDPKAWALEELADAADRRDSSALSESLSVGYLVGMDARWSAPLADLLVADWHISHEFIAFELGWVGDEGAVPALVHAAHWVPEHLEFDETRQLASKAIHSLGKIPGPVAEGALRSLLNHEDHDLRRTVRRVLDRRLAHPSSR